VVFCFYGDIEELIEMAIIVQKFGGTSVSSVERIRHVAEMVAKTKAFGYQCVVVVSAMGQSTDELIHLAYQISDKPSAREMDMLLTAGEQMSMALLTMALQAKDLKARSLTGWQAGIQTDQIHGKARVQQIDITSISACLERDEIVVVAGFQGVTADGQITTLGRGGSDTSAVTLAAALSAELCEIYTDVAGVYTADPCVIPLARKIDEISYEEMLELAHLGAGVLHPRAVECALIHQVHLMVRSSFVDESGTRIKEVHTMEKKLHVSGITHDLSVARMKVFDLPNREDTLTKLFTLLAEAHINVDMIVQSEHDQGQMDVAFSVAEEEGKLAQQLLEKAREELKYDRLLLETGLAKVSAVGIGMMTNPGVAAKFFATLSEAGISIKMVSTSEIKISCLMERELALQAVWQLHTAFGLDVKFYSAESVGPLLRGEGI
jgi:aspartate kinase